MQLLNDLVELARKATPGEWWIDSHGMAMVAHDDENTMIVFVTDGEQMVNPAIRHEDTGNLSHWRNDNDNDATFIAAANPAAILAIAEYVKGLEARTEAFNSEARSLAKAIDSHVPDTGKMTGWVKCSERMPEDDTLCLAIDEQGVIWTAHYDCGELSPDVGGMGDVPFTHWQPLPSPPTE